MHTLFLDAPYTGMVELSKDTLSYLKKKKIKIVALYASVQFVHLLEKVREQLAALKIRVIISQPRRTHVSGQLLGCDNDKEALNLSDEQFKNIDAFLYVGDGKFHPLALVFAQKDIPGQERKEILCNDPMARKLTVMTANDTKKLLLQYRSSLMKFLSSERVGVIVTIKPGQQQLRAAYQLEKRFPDKKFYYFVDNVISFDQLENFPFIQTWVNTACPRIGLDDHEKFRNGVINLRDALQVDRVLGGKDDLSE